MKCINPKLLGSLSLGCRKCSPCRLNSRREWVCRLLLEASCHVNTAFVTLTFDDKKHSGHNHVAKRHVQQFIRELRNILKPRQIRYYFAAEYGAKNGRPHYHGIIYGLSPTEITPVEKAWPFGATNVKAAEPRTIAYTASYVTKKQTELKTDPDKEPGFYLMSQRPGIGANIADRISQTYLTNRGAKALDKNTVPKSLIRASGSMYALPRYIKEKIYTSLQIDSETKKKAINDYLNAKAYSQDHLEAGDLAAEWQLSIQKQNHQLKRKGLA